LHEWINTDDAFPNFQFAESLMNCLGDEGTIFMWAPHENTILNAILTQMGARDYNNPALKKWLNSVIRDGTGNSGRLAFSIVDAGGSMYLTQIRSKAATGFNWQSLYASAAINMISRFQKQPFFQTSPICVKYILPVMILLGQPMSNTLA